MKALKVFAIGAEATVVSTLAVSSYHIAFSGPNPDWLAAAPLLTVVALESLRLPIAFNLPRTRLTGTLLSGAMLIGLSVITGEAASVAFENLIFQRTRPVVEAERDLTDINIARASLTGQTARHDQIVARLTADVETARKHRAEIDKPVQLQASPTLQTIPPAQTCRGKKGVTWNCGAGAQEAVRKANATIQTKIAADNATAQASHDAELKAADARIDEAAARLAAVPPTPDMSASDADVAAAQRRVTDARTMNPMFRVAAAWQKIPVEKLSSEDFEGVKHYAVIALATATAVTSALVAFLSALPERGNNGKIGRAIRKMAAARRRTVRKFVERIEYRDRTKFVYVPCDPMTGKALDPEGKAQGQSSPNLKVV